MKGIILSSVLLASSISPATADPRVAASDADPRIATQLRQLERDAATVRAALQAAHERKLHARAKWDAAVAGDHPVSAGIWARRHSDALQAYRDAQQSFNAAAARVAALQFARR